MALMPDVVIGVLLFLTVCGVLLLTWYVITKKQRRWKVQMALRQMEANGSVRHEIVPEVPSVASEFIVSVDGGRREDVFGKCGEVDQEVVNLCLAEMSDSVDKTKHHEVVCSICLDELLADPNAQCYIAPTCGHGFHLTCLGKWVYTRRDITCPNCKTQLFPVNVESMAPGLGLGVGKSESRPRGENMA